MPSWYAKAVVQGALSMLPAPQRWNRLLQARVTRSLRLTDAYLVKKWERTVRHVDAWRTRATAGATDFHAVELGTGWFPITSVGFALCGAYRVTTYDIDALADRETVLAVLARFDRLIAAGEIVPPRDDARALLGKVLADPVDNDARGLLTAIGVDARIADARSSGLPDASVDLIASTSTLEHIPPHTLEGLFTEFRRIVRSDGVMSHLVDMSDHYAQVDPSLTRLNFLRYSKRTWGLFNNRLHYQNRLRITDYRDLLAATGWRIVDERDAVRTVEELHRVPLHPDFAGYAEDDLRVSSSRLVCVPVVR